jgi:uncharacterized protein
MKFNGSVEILANQQKVWDFLTDPDLVSQCAPGVEKVEIIEPNKKFKAIVSVGFGNLKAKFANDIEFVSLDMPSQAVIKVHGRAPGSAVDVMATMNLVSIEENITEINWEADINVLGTIAALANRMMGSVTKKLTTEFFKTVKGKIEG